MENNSTLEKILLVFNRNAELLRGASFYLLYMNNLFKFEVAILKIKYNMTSSNITLTLKVNDRMIPFKLNVHFLPLA